MDKESKNTEVFSESESDSSDYLERVSFPKVYDEPKQVYNEPYKTLPMRGEVGEEKTQYELQQAGQWQGMVARPTGDWHEPTDGVCETFLIEPYWGYNRQSNGDTMEYEVTHPPWRTRAAQLACFDLDVELLYGSQWAEALASEPDAVVLAEGSAVTVFSGTWI